MDKEKIVKRHHPKLEKIDTDSPLTVGNGNFAFTADPTGMQTFYELYESQHNPLCTMAQWGWHTTPAAHGTPFTLEDVEPTEYDYENRKIKLPVEKRPGSEEAYQWLRENPHRPNLARISLSLNGHEIEAGKIQGIQQELNLHEGVLESTFMLGQDRHSVQTLCDPEHDLLAFSLSSRELMPLISFPYGASNMSGSDWESPQKHHSRVLQEADGRIIIEREMDGTRSYVFITGSRSLSLKETGTHCFRLSCEAEIGEGAAAGWAFTIHFAQSRDGAVWQEYCQTLERTKVHWRGFWKGTGLVDFEGSKDPRAFELERRIVLSQYLLKIQSSGSLPPQETGLTCNSWHGKFHLEMHLWHAAWLPLWNNGDLLEKSLPWYQEILPKAKENAAKNGFKGAKWPKQVAADGIDSPSVIATLLIWQQSHILYLLELIHRQDPSSGLLAQYWEVVQETADFMCDFLSFNEATGCYELAAPIIPAQEEHDPRHVKNPTFEVEYWRFSLGLAVKWAQRLGKPSHHWERVLARIVPSPVKEGLYLAHENCPDTFTRFNRDHPSMLGAFGLIPNDRLDENALGSTVEKVLSCWEFETMWGWDFALMAMTAVRLGLPDLAMDILMMDSPKNQYVASGNNYQRLRTDLPLYLPGNGSLLLAVALMVAGYEGCGEELPGIPKNGQWQVEYENIGRSM